MEVVTAVSGTDLLTADDLLFESLLSISDLYTHYAKPLQLYELCLLILYTAEYKDTHVVQQTWIKLIKQVLEPGANVSPVESAETDNEGARGMQKLVVLEEKVKGLGVRYLGEENVFPLGFLCTYLETTIFGSPGLRSNSDSWVIRVMLSIGVKHAKLFDIYNEMFEARSTSPLNTKEGEQWIAGRFGFLIGKWVDLVEFSPTERARFPAKNVDDALSKLLMVCGGSGGGGGGGLFGGAGSLGGAGGGGVQKKQQGELRVLQDRNDYQAGHLFAESGRQPQQQQQQQ
ncbi:hypothetical protein HDU98_000348 [Podochytrium sp. JEL0797]|nr:hypothetical protein HDU98_000348 [Podochytrium sp. JEL0797]